MMDHDIHFHSSEDMSELDDESVAHVVTSPPYNVNWDYGDYDDGMHYYDEYLPLLARVFSECYRVLKPGGRMCVNVPDLVRSGVDGGFSISGDIINMMTAPFLSDSYGVDMLELNSECDWRVREVVVWNKGFNTPGFGPMGSFPRPYGIMMNNFHEVVLVCQKPGTRDYADLPDEFIEVSKKQLKLKKAACGELTDDVWNIESVTGAESYGQRIPQFPVELPRRSIILWSYAGDLILDPFLGSGTTLAAAKELGRNGVGYEIRHTLSTEIESRLIDTKEWSFNVDATESQMPGWKPKINSPEEW